MLKLPRYIQPGLTLAYGDPDGTCVYHQTYATDRHIVVCYRHKQSKPCENWRFSTEEKRNAWSHDWYLKQLRFADDKLKRKEAAKAEKSAFACTLKPGDILSSSWGYDQTNVDFFQVVEVIGKATVTLQAMKQEETESHSGMSGQCRPTAVNPDAKPFRARQSPSGSVKVGHQHASLWDGRAMYYSSYA
jgi:hypothetical protein